MQSLNYDSMDQDQINIHKAIYDINQRMQTMRNDITALFLKHDLLLAKLESRIKATEIAFENFTNKIMKISDEQTQKIGDIQTSIEDLKKEVFFSFNAFERKYLKSGDYIDGYRFLCKQDEDLRAVIEKKQDFFNDITRNLRNHLDDEIMQVREDLKPVKPEVDPKKEVEEMLTAFRVDMKGVNKELILLKKSKAYNDKKFENIYTLIERLKEKS